MCSKRFTSTFQSIVNVAKFYKPGDNLSVQGWIKNIRRLKNNIFLDINDGSTSIKFQIVTSKNEQAQKITIGSVVCAAGQLQIAPNGHYELHATDLKSISDGKISASYPFTPKQKHPPEYVREYLHLRSRIDYIAAQMRLRHRAQKAIHDFMDDQGFIQINTPILTSNDCEGAGEVFRVQPDSMELLQQMSRANIPTEQSYFDRKVFLTVSGQLHLEAMSYGLGNTYCLGPTFRAENSKSPLHLAEFYMLEAELAFIESLSELTNFIENMLKEITIKIVNNSIDDINCCQQITQYADSELSWLKNAWTTLSYDEAALIITNNKEKFNTSVDLKYGFTKEQELFLVAYCGNPVFIIDWPKHQKPFYMKTSRIRPECVYALDLLMPYVGELCGGSLREDDFERLSAHEQFPRDLEWYLELRKFGGIPTGGFGMGFDRYLQLLTGFKSIRDVIPFPRYPHSCKM